LDWAGTYVFNANDPLNPIAYSGGVGAYLLGVLPVPAAANVSRTFTNVLTQISQGVISDACSLQVPQDIYSCHICSEWSRVPLFSSGVPIHVGRVVDFFGLPCLLHPMRAM
jgi:hypothetical protein